MPNQNLRTQQDTVEDMCFVQHEDKQLLLVTRRIEGLFAYNTKTPKLEWKVDEKLPGMEEKMHASAVTTDGRGHLFVRDWMTGNSSVQMFSVSGKYLGCLTINYFGAPARVHFCTEASCIIVAILFHGNLQLLFINVQYC